MPEIIVDGKVRNVSQRKIAKKGLQDSIKQNVKATASTYAGSVTEKGNELKTSVKNATETKVNQVTGDITGGIESVTNLTKDVSGKLNSGAVEGVITDQLTSLENSLNSAGDTILGSATKNTQGIRLTLGWSDPDSDGNVRLIQSTADASAQVDASINAMLTKITNLNVFNGYVQKVAGNVTPQGIPSLLEKMKGGIGAFPSLDKLNELTAQANAIADTAATGIQGAVGDVVGGALPPNPAAAAGDVGKNLAGALDGAADAQTKLQGLGDSLTGAVTQGVNNVSASVTDSIKINDDKLKADLELQTGKSNILDDAKNGIIAKLDDLKSGIEDYEKNVSAVFGGSLSGVIQGLGEKESGNGSALVKAFSPDLSPKEIDEIVTLSQGTQEEQDRAIDLLEKKSGKSRDEIKSTLQDLDTTIAGTVLVENEETAFADPFDLVSSSDPVGTKGQTFTYVSSVEELEVEMNRVVRDVTEIVVHWTDSYTNKNIGSEEINENHIQLGLSKGIGYHYVIRRDGSLQRGRPVNIEGEHAEINGHDQYSIAIAFVGGINAPSGTEFSTSYRSASSLTNAQMNTFKEFCQAFYNRFPGGQILGHNDIDQSEEDPGFDVRDYVEDIFNRKSLFEDPLSRGPFTPQELNTAEIP